MIAESRTARYADFRPAMGVLGRTTVGAPRGWTGPIEQIRWVTPYGVFGLSDDCSQYEQLYTARLQAAVDALAERCVDLSARHGSANDATAQRSPEVGP